ncbi:hypothetical protein ADQ49_28335 [Salmonella enterica subsp. enterica]|nr:hypothetical protein [Salmonella enterica subsp. enterica serovar Enteritidis]
MYPNKEGVKSVANEILIMSLILTLNPEQLETLRKNAIDILEDMSRLRDSNLPEKEVQSFTNDLRETLMRTLNSNRLSGGCE